MELSETPVTVLEKTIKLVEKYGVWKIIRAILLIGLLLYVVFNINSIPQTIKEIVVSAKEIDIAKHDAAIEVRKHIKPQIDEILSNTLTAVEADRVFVLEMHNGTNNTSGLPFLYVEMTYCQVADGVNHIDEDYINLNLSRFDFPLYLEDKQYWYGSVEELRQIDPKMAMRLESNGAKYFAIMTIQGVKNELGYFGVSFTHDIAIENTDNLMMTLTSATQKISTLLDKSMYEIDAMIDENTSIEPTEEEIIE